MFDRLFEFLFAYRPVVFSQGELRFAAWGGSYLAVVAALIAVVLAAWLYTTGSQPTRVLYTLTYSNAWMIALNLLPIPPLDGAEAWRLPILLGRSLRKGPVQIVMPPPPEHGARDEDFEAGHRRDEVKAIVSNLLDDARKE